MREHVLLPPLKAILDLHAELLAEWGGAAGIRDMDALEAALARPQHILAYSADPITVFDLAAALCASICRHHHPFVDGNKRTAFAALGVTLGLNGLYLDVAEREAAEKMTALAAGGMGEQAFRDWVADNSFELRDAGPG
ncbi:MAG TPA: type II toxin-antitoxin system death-on-curing family toxin [Acidiphilium sp.]